MLIPCARNYNLVSNPELYKILFQIGRKTNVDYVGKVFFKKNIHYSAIRWTKGTATKILRDKNRDSKYINRLFSLAKPEKYKLAAAIGLLVVSSGVTMSIPFAMGKVIDIIYSMDNLKTEHSFRNTHDDLEESLMSDAKRQSIMTNSDNP